MEKTTSLIRKKYDIITVFNNDTVFEGDLKFSTSLKILGKYKGTIQTEGILYLGENSEVFANIQANIVIIAGFFKGDIIANDIIEMQSTGKIYGTIQTKKLKIEDGVVFEGKCEMINEQKD